MNHEILKKIFIFYASFGDRNNLDYLHSNKFHRLLHDTNLNSYFKK